jgi:hypothetical protein
MTAISDAPDSDSDAALEQIRRTHGHVPDGFRLLAEHAPEAFLGYMGLREFVFRALTEGHLAISMKEFDSVLLDIQAGNIRGAHNHLRNAMRTGPIVGQLTEGLAQFALEIAGETKPSAS